MPAWGNFLLDKGFKANAALTKFRAVQKGTNSTEVAPVTVNTQEIVGFPQFSISAAELADGKDASVRMLGVTEAEASGAIAYMAWVTMEADGRVSQLVGASGKTIVGKCVGSPATNAGDRIALLIVHTNVKA
jgi:hypothetical protein